MEILCELHSFIPGHTSNCLAHCCDHAVNLAFDIALFFWLFDAPTGYHQLAVYPELQEKLTFKGTDTIKWTYTVMPFKLTNNPTTFIQMIHDLDSALQDLGTWLDISVDDNTNTNIIVDDIFQLGSIL